MLMSFSPLWDATSLVMQRRASELADHWE